MKIWESPFKQVTKKACICGKETGTIKVNMVFLKRSIWAQVIVVPLLFGAIYFAGIEEVFAKAWWLIVLEGAIVLVIMGKMIERLGQRHTIKCALY